MLSDYHSVTIGTTLKIIFSYSLQMTIVKKNMRQFSGFDFDKEDPNYEKREAKLLK